MSLSPFFVTCNQLYSILLGITRKKRVNVYISFPAPPWKSFCFLRFFSFSFPFSASICAISVIVYTLYSLFSPRYPLYHFLLYSFFMQSFSLVPSKYPFCNLFTHTIYLSCATFQNTFIFQSIDLLLQFIFSFSAF